MNRKLFGFYEGGIQDQESCAVRQLDESGKCSSCDVEGCTVLSENTGVLQENNKNIKILLLEDVSQNAVDKLLKERYEVEVIKKSLNKEELIEKIKDVHVLGIRSRTLVTSEVLKHAKNLLCIGCFCIGTNQVDLEEATSRGIVVFNSPYQNSRSVAELIICAIILLSRQLGDRNIEMHQGKWNKTSRNCFEVRGKTLGVVGYGHIGSQVSILAESLGMHVVFYDIASPMALGNSRKLEDLDSLLAVSDIVTLHVPQTEKTARMFTKNQFVKMKKGSILLNASRGNVVDLDDLYEALQTHHLAGAYLDVFPTEPMSNGAFQGYEKIASCPNVLLTPHIGGSTLEAQSAIGDEVSSRIVSFLNTGKTVTCVNFPEVELVPVRPDLHRIINVHQNKPGVLKEINNILCHYNVEGQILRTFGHIGYFIADFDSKSLNRFGDRVAALSSSILTRVIYHNQEQ
ncbi:D-3-phosphoglycerate dehydrogenase-like [Schistocerca gregaria]|uniref:D-3-phosphoglycerate dehydrogenase-like n=1 Tax=Schistocerca gregaria TaxID=7010 RepID=UPI00211EF478|nr:D-3-phosphoglycerate dehydrogenase-like [Schistocerca gregaria]